MNIIETVIQTFAPQISYMCVNTAAYITSILYTLFESQFLAFYTEKKSHHNLINNFN